MAAVIEFTMTVKPGHYDGVLAAYIAFADEFVQSNPDEELALITGDAASGTIRGIGVFDTAQAGGAANSRASFAAFMDQVEPMIAGPPERIELDLAHVYVRQ